MTPIPLTITRIGTAQPGEIEFIEFMTYEWGRRFGFETAPLPAEHAYAGATITHPAATGSGLVIPGDGWSDDWKRNGFNGAITQAQEALRYLAEHDRPSGGEQFPNSASCHMIADELEITRKRYAALAAAPTPDAAASRQSDGDPDGWLAVKVNGEGGIVMPYGPLHPGPDRPADPRYQWAPFYLGEPA